MKLCVSANIVPVSDQGAQFLFHVQNCDLVRINETAVIVTELADGTLTAEALLAEIAGRHGREKSEKCRKWMEKALDTGLLEYLEDQAEWNPPGVAELHAIASRLMAADDVRKAYLVQKRAVALPGAVAEHWYQMGELAHIAGNRDEARTAYERYAELVPDDPEVAHILKALRNEPPPQRAPDDYLKHLYKRFSEYYESSMCGDLRYKAPEVLAAAVRRCLGGRSGLAALDLGCGTGLYGMQIHPLCKSLTGVDLSPEMLEKSAARSVYDHLECAEITAWLAGQVRETYDLIAFCDTLIYFGDLTGVLAGCVKHLKPGGLVAFTLEKGPDSPFRLSDSGRFQHHKNHVRDAARAAGLEIIHRAEETLRMEYGVPVTGLVTVLQKLPV